MKNALFCSFKLQTIGNHFLKELTHRIEKNNGPKGLWDIIRQFPWLEDNHSLGLLQLLRPNSHPKAGISDPEEEDSDLLMHYQAFEVDPGKVVRTRGRLT